MFPLIEQNLTNFANQTVAFLFENGYWLSHIFLTNFMKTPSQRNYFFTINNDQQLSLVWSYN